MRDLRAMGLALFAVFAVVAVSASSAYAELPEILTTVPQAFVSKGVGNSKLLTLGGKAIECTALSNKGTATTKKGGEITLTFTGCTSEAGKVKCKTGSEAAGTLVFKTNFEIVDVEAGSPAKLLLAILVTLKETLLITCGVLKVEVKGSAIGEATKYQETAKEKTEKLFKEAPMPAAGTVASVSGIEVTDLFAQSGGDQTIQTCKLPKATCEGKTYKLEANFGSGFESAGQESTDELESEGGTTVTIDY